MLMTEDEAREKWCPFSRAALLKPGIDHPDLPVGTPSFNRFALDTKAASPLTSPPACGCLASRCMAWRFEAAPSLVSVQVGFENIAEWEDAGYKKSMPGDGDGRWWMDPPDQKSPARGYCGLAGKP